MPDATAPPKVRSLTRRLASGLVVTFLAVVLAGLLLWLCLHHLGLTVIRAEKHSALLEETQRAPDLESKTPEDLPSNVILFVADGLGFAHLSVARAALHGIDGAAAWDRLPATGWHRPHPEAGFLTDSAASATALATGVPTANGAVGVDVDGRPLTTWFEHADQLGYRTGIVTDSYVWDATPAAFATHCSDRDEAETILRQLAESPLEVLFGELEDLGEGEVPEWAPSVKILEQRFQVVGPGAEALDDLPPTGSAQPVAAIFEEDQVTDLRSTPNLPALVTAALDRLSSGPRPFVLLVESEEPDSACHKGDLARLLRGMEAIEASLELLLDFADDDGETLVVFTSDHETGGLALSVAGTNSQLLALWATDGHTGVAVPVLASGPGSEHFAGIHSNTEIGQLLAHMLRRLEG